MADQPAYTSPWRSPLFKEMSPAPVSDNGKQEDRKTNRLDAYANAFIPQYAKPGLGSFAMSGLGHDKPAAEDYSDEAELSNLLNAQLLKDLDASISIGDMSGTKRDNNTPTHWSPLKDSSPSRGWFSSPIANDQETNVKSIWDGQPTTTERDTGRWDRFEPYSDEAEFDPTLQFYHGSLLDGDTIRDIKHLSLSAMDPSVEEKHADNVGEDMSPLQMLESVFADLSESELADALAKHDYDVDRTMEFFLSRTRSDVINPVLPQTGNEDATPKRQVCRHFLAGECYRKDCWYSHDLQIKVCKFWLQGLCMKGDVCEFSHVINVQEAASKIQTAIKKEEKKPISFDEHEYPELGRTSQRQRPPPQGQPPSDTKQTMTDDFPSLSQSSALGYSIPAKAKKPVNFAEAAKAKKATSKVSAKPATFKTSSIPTHQLKRPVSIPWLETGSALNTIYLKQRKQAIEYGILRNRLFTRSSECYQKGDGAKARAFSQEAKYYNRLMQEMHTEASRRIFEQRNQSEAFVDLHGLHVDEALDMLEERLERLCGYEGIVYVVTGTGHHSGTSGLSRKQSKLKPSVENYLREMNYRFAETSVVGDAKGGVFAVDLSAQ